MTQYRHVRTKEVRSVEGATGEGRALADDPDWVHIGGDVIASAEATPPGTDGAPGADTPDGSPGPGSGARDAHSADAETFDPAEHTVSDVVAHLAELAEGDQERDRILEAERAGKARTGILGTTTTTPTPTPTTTTTTEKD